MAKNIDAAEKKKRKGIVQRMMFGNDQKPDLTPEQMKMGKWELFKFLFFHRFGTMVLLNILTVLFALPGVIVYLLFYLNASVAAGFIPYSGNLGIGYPVVVDAVQNGAMVAFSYTLNQFLVLVPCIALLALGISGNLYVIRKLIWGEPTRTAKDFFIGIKKCWLPALVCGLLFGLSVLFVAFSLDFFDVYYLSGGLKALSITVSIILLVFMILFASFFMTQNAAFKMKFTVLVRNSVLFVLGTNIQAILFIGLSLIPVYLMFIPGITMILMIIYIILGFSFSTLGISVYCHGCYEKFLYDKITDKPSTMYTKRPSDFTEDDELKTKKKKQTVQYKNPKKRKKSIDEGVSITPLAPTFRREDLERLEREHEMIMRESADEPNEQAEPEEPPQEQDVDADTPDEG